MLENPILHIKEDTTNEVRSFLDSISKIDVRRAYFMTTQRIKLGQIGEDAAVAFLKQQGYRIFERNFRNKLGEIDIIAQDGNTLCFVEVKTRKTDTYGSPYESITPAKQKKIVQVALSYLKFTGKMYLNARFDVIAVFLEGEYCQRIDIIKNAFDAG